MNEERRREEGLLVRDWTMCLPHCPLTSPYVHLVSFFCKLWREIVAPNANTPPSACPVTHPAKRGTTFRPTGFLEADGLRSLMYLVQNYVRPVKDRGMKKCAPPCFTGVFSCTVLSQREARARPCLSPKYSLDTTHYRMIQHGHFIWWSWKHNFSSQKDSKTLTTKKIIPANISFYNWRLVIKVEMCETCAAS